MEKPRPPDRLPGTGPDGGFRIAEGANTVREGTGVGLAIVERVAEAHDWDVTAGESETGGARFEVRF